LEELGYRGEVGKVPVGVNTADSDFSTVEKTGGSKYLQSHNHTGTTGGGKTEFMRIVGAAGTSVAHNHTTGYSSASYVDRTGGTSEFNGSNHWHEFTTNNSGSGNSGNLQPYICCYMWKRTA